MNANGKEVEFIERDNGIDVSVDRSAYPFDTYIVGVIKLDPEEDSGGDRFYRFYPNQGVVMNVSLLRAIMNQLSRLNTKT